MIIKEIYIAGFGKLRDFKKTFKTGLNSITEENGFGKTTMTMFITSMLYGLPDTRSTKLEENPRKRYTPWDCNAFGGYIIFEEGGRSYRAERSFGKKASDDTFELIDLITGKSCNDYSENLGEDIFGIDADGFERTVFLSERNLSGKNTNPTVAAKLSNITYADGDIGGYESAIKLLDAKRRAYQRRGGSGEIQDLENKIAELEDTVRELRGKRESSEEYTARIAELDAQIESIKRESEELHFSKKAMEHELKRREKENEYSSMMMDIAPDAFRESELLEFFDRKVPTDDEMESIHRAVRELSEKRDELKAVSVPPIANSVITKRAPDSVELMELRKRIGEINSLENTVINRQPRPESVFKTPPTLDEIRKLRTPQGGNSRTAFTVILIGIVLAATLALRLVMDSVIPVISGICGILLTIVGIYLAFSKKSKTNDAAIFEYAALCYVTPPKEDLSADEVLDKLEGDLDSYEYETRVYAAHYEKCDEAEKALPIKLRELDEFISRFTDKTGSKECAEALFYAALSYASEKNAAGENEAKAAAIRAEIEELEGRIAAFASRYPTEGTDAIAEIDRKLTEYKTLARMLAARRDTIKRFAEENPIVMEGPPALLGFDATRNYDTDAADIDARRLAAERERTRLGSEYERLILDIEKIDEYEEKLRELRESADAKRTSFAVIKKTMDILGNAKEKLTARYLDKVRRGFDKYVSVMDIGNDFSIDTEFNVTRIDLGKSRAPEAYSRGTRDLFALAMRLALIDALFEDAKPPVILDDPFSALDDQRLKTAIETVQRISRDRQIFYFTCTTSRQI